MISDVILRPLRYGAGRGGGGGGGGGGAHDGCRALQLPFAVGRGGVTL